MSLFALFIGKPVLPYNDDMHHSLLFYGRYQHQFLRLYMLLARLTAVPWLGGLVRRAANNYGQRGHGAYLLTLAEAEAIVDASNEVALGPCSCRQLYHHCHSPVMSEILVGEGVAVFAKNQGNGFRKVSKAEAKDVLRQCHEQRLTHTMVQCRQHFYAICNCCSCCCVPTRLRQRYGIEYALVRDPAVVADYQKQRL